MMRGFVPDHILQHLAANHAKSDVRAAAIRSLTLSSRHRVSRRARFFGVGAVAPQKNVSIAVYTANGNEIQPGALVRKDTTTPAADAAVNSAYDDAAAVIDFYFLAFNRSSIDGNGMGVVSTIHYGRGYDNAFWDGRQMVYGDGDGYVFRPFVEVIDIPGHEMSHGVTQYTSNLDYQNQPGALNESFSDCMGSCVKQFKLQQTADKADWLIGQGLFYPSINGRALRDMRNPGTAFDDPSLGGKDPQPAHMKDYVHTSDDDGGVHLNSGIPNKAFADACVAVGGHSWEKVGLVWYKTNQTVTHTCDFQTWAQTTVDIGSQLFGDVGKAIADAWAGVGITTKVPGSPAPAPSIPVPPLPQPVPSGPPLATLLRAVDAEYAAIVQALAQRPGGPWIVPTVLLTQQYIDATIKKVYQQQS